MQEWASRLDADIHPVGLGQEASKSIIYVRPEIGGSSIFEEQGEITIADSYEIDIVRLDELISSFEKPALVKIDVQGAELGVLRGMAGGGGERNTATNRHHHCGDEPDRHAERRGSRVCDCVRLSQRARLCAF